MITAGIDLAFARDSSALVIGSEIEGVCTVLEMIEVRGGDASDPRIVVAAFIASLRNHGVSVVMADCHYRKLLQMTLAEHEINLLPEPAGAHGNTAVYLHARRVIATRRLVVPEHPLRARLAQQLRDTRGKPMSGGAMAIEHSRKDGGHGDLVSALVLMLWQLRDQSIAEPQGVRGETAELFEANMPLGEKKTRYHRDGEPLLIGVENSGRFDGYDGSRWDGMR